MAREAAMQKQLGEQFNDMGFTDAASVPLPVSATINQPTAFGGFDPAATAAAEVANGDLQSDGNIAFPPSSTLPQPVFTTSTSNLPSGPAVRLVNNYYY